MAQAANKIADAASDIRGVQNRLNGQKAEMLSGWQGNASTAFNGVFTRFDESFRKVLEQLDGMHEKLVQTKIKYAANEEQQEQSINKINSLLNG